MKRLAFTVLTSLCGAATGTPVDPRSTPAPDAGNESLTPIVLACVGKDGKLLSTEIARSSGVPEIDEAALKVARAARFKPGENALGAKKRKSCVKFKVKFVLQDGVPVPAPT
jgi:TonB family protein